MGLYELTERLGRLEGLDALGDVLADVASKAMPHGPVKDLASGTWLGHALHPMLTDVPIGTWVSASSLDIIGGDEGSHAAELLIGVGLAAAVPTVASGLSDFSDTYGGERRIGVVHAASNGAVSLLYAGSLWARRRGNRGVGLALGFTGLGVALASAYIGGHLSLALGIGVDHTAFDAGPGDWTSAMALDDLDSEPKKVDVEGASVMIVRQGERIHALLDRCSHLGGPLHEGEIKDGTVVCPWHLSAFRLEDGSVARGPARAPQPAFDVRVHDGQVQIRPRAEHA